ncbi:MAG: DUF4416 family protein [Syntrophorhabdales bacterium]
MGTIKFPPPVQFFASIIFADSCILSGVEEELTRVIGPIGERTDVMAFSQSDYYCPEMGGGLRRYFLLFEPLLDRDMLAPVKLATNGVEHLRSNDGRRAVNVDPGYLALEHVVLGTTKGYSHRIYLGRGIFADLTLLFENGSYRAMKWTYPDYGSGPVIRLMNGWREHYKRVLRCQGA